MEDSEKKRKLQESGFCNITSLDLAESDIMPQKLLKTVMKQNRWPTGFFAVAKEGIIFVRLVKGDLWARVLPDDEIERTKLLATAAKISPNGEWSIELSNTTLERLQYLRPKKAHVMQTALNGRA